MADITKTTILDIDASKSTKSVKELRNELKALKDQMAGVEEGSQQFYDLANAAGTVKHQIDEILQSVSGASADFGDMLNSATKSAAGVVGAFQTVKGAMTLMGVESENVEKAIQKMQASMAIIQGLDAIDNGIKGFKKFTTAIQISTKGLSGFKKALIGTGLGALVVVLGEVIAHFDEISAWLDEITGQTDFLGVVGDSVIGGLQAAWVGLKEGVISVGQAIITYITAPFKSIVEAVKAYTEGNGSIVDRLKAAGAAAKKEFTNEWKDVGNSFKEVGTKAAEAFTKGQEAHRIKRLTKDIEDAKKDATAVAEAKVEAEEKIKEMSRQEELKNLKTNYQYQVELLKKSLADLELSLEQFNERKKELDNAYNQDLKDSLQAIYEDETQSYEDRLAALQEFNKMREEESTTSTETDTTTEDSESPDSKAQSIADTINSAANMLSQFSDDPAWNNIVKQCGNIAAAFGEIEKAEKNGEKGWQAYAQVAAAGFSAIGSVMNSLASEQDTTTKEGFEQQKKYQIAATTMNMLGGIASAWVSAMSPANAWMTLPGQAAMGAVMSALMLTTGLMQISKIKLQQFEGGSASTSSPSSSVSNSALSSIQAPVQYTQDVQGASIEQSIKDTRVYVTETDISNTQRKVNVAESENIY